MFRQVALLLVACALPPSLNAATVEVMLIDRLDEPRGYCLDIVGSQARATPERGLQAHTCYSYQGRIAVDQAFDSARVADGVFFMPAFNVCASPVTVQPGAAIVLGACATAEMRPMTLRPDGRIVLQEAPGLCLTIAGGKGTPGGGGNPVHVLRGLTLENCSEKLDAFQKWRTRFKYD